MKLERTYTCARSTSAPRPRANLGLTLAVSFGLSSAGLLAAGCGDAFTSCEASRTCPSGGQGSGGEGGGAAGSDVVAVGGSVAETTGGTAGVGGKDVDVVTAGTAGDGDDTEPEPECEDEGRHECGTPGTAERRVCQEGQWVLDDCEPEHVCSLTDQTCVSIAEECQGRAPDSTYCADAERIVCSGDRSTVVERELCNEKCSEGQCLPAECGDGQVDGAEECDDGNAIGGDGCHNDCTWGPKELVLGGHTSCVWFGNGWAKCWGDNREGQLGVGDRYTRGATLEDMGANLPYIEVNGAPAVFSALDVSMDHGCGIVDGAAWCWGDNYQGELGVITTTPAKVLTPRTVPLYKRVKTVVTGDSFSCALLEEGRVKCWGRGPALGIPFTSQVFGATLNEMGSVLVPIDLGDGLVAINAPPPADPAIALDAGLAHACALLKSGKVFCWGDSSVSQLGFLNHEDHGGVPAELIFGPNPVAMQSLAVGGNHSCAMSSVGLKCWGQGSSGQLGYGSSAERLAMDPGLVPVSIPSDPIVRVRAMEYATCALLQSNALKCWGEGWVIRSNYVLYYGTIAQPELVALVGHVGDEPDEVSQLHSIDFGTDERILSFDTGAHHGCALFESGTIKCWGLNEFGQLGVGHSLNVGVTAEELGANWVETRVQ